MLSVPTRIKRMLQVLALLPLGTLHMACVTTPDGSKAKDFLNQDLTGRIAGKDWKYKHAYIDPSITTPEEDDYVFIFLPYVPSKPCPHEGDAAAGNDTRVAMVSAPTKDKKLVKLKRGGKRTLIFQFDRKSEQVALSAKTGKLQLTVTGGDKIQGKILAQINGDNWLNGNFTAVVCDLTDMRKARGPQYDE